MWPFRGHRGQRWSNDRSFQIWSLNNFFNKMTLPLTSNIKVAHCPTNAFFCAIFVGLVHSSRQCVVRYHVLPYIESEFALKSSARFQT